MLVAGGGVFPKDSVDFRCLFSFAIIAKLNRSLQSSQGIGESQGIEEELEIKMTKELGLE